MAAVIHSLWERQDGNLLIMPANVPVDGPLSLPLALDRENPNLGRYSACRRVARTIYLGSAPTQRAANRGIDDRQVRLGCVQPGETAAIFGDALRRLTDRATYLYVDGRRFWFSTQPTVTRLAEDRAAQLREEDVLAPEHPHTGRDPASPARREAATLLDSRGTSPRTYKNTLVFLAADGGRLKDLEQATRQYLAWQSIWEERESLNLDAFQSRQAETKCRTADETVEARIPEAYQWLLVPTQPDPKGPVEWQEIRQQGQEALAVRASKKLKNEELLLVQLGGPRLRHELDRVPLWRGDHVGTKQLAEDFATYLYLPRLSDDSVLADAIRDGLSRLTWQTDTFAYADHWDEQKRTYVGLQTGPGVRVTLDERSLLVKPEVALAQMQAERERQAETQSQPAGESGAATKVQEPGEGPPTPPVSAPPRRFHATVLLDPPASGGTQVASRRKWSSTWPGSWVPASK